MKLEDAGIAHDEREGTTMHTSATTGPARTLEEATTAALTSLVRTADENDLDVDPTTLSTRVKVMGSPGGGRQIMVIATAIGYPA